MSGLRAAPKRARRQLELERSLQQGRQMGFTRFAKY